MFSSKKKVKIDVDIVVHYVEGPKLLDVFRDLKLEMKCGKDKVVSKSVREGAAATCEFVEAVSFSL
jgi:hypothetical protein